MKILHIDSSPLGDASASRRLTASIVQTLSRSVPGAEISHRDLAAAPPAHLSGQVLQAMTSPQPEGQGQNYLEIRMRDFSHTQPDGIKARIRWAAETTETIEHLAPERLSGHAAGG